MKNILIIVGILFGLIWIASSAFCINEFKNSKISFSISFESGSSSEELANFINDLETTYPTVVVKKEFDGVPDCNDCRPASIGIWASTRELVGEKEFSNFLTKEFDKYKSLKIGQFSGSGGSLEDIFDRGMETSFCFSPISIPYSVYGLINLITK